MTVQNYFLINTSTEPKVCENIISWDPENSSWKPELGYVMIPVDTVIAIDWIWNQQSKSWTLGDVAGSASIGYTWNGEKLVTNRPMPEPIPIGEVAVTKVKDF